MACCRFVLVAGEEKGFAGHMLEICTYTYSHREQAQQDKVGGRTDVLIYCM
jgi:hypothetical protein